MSSSFSWLLDVVPRRGGEVRLGRVPPVPIPITPSVTREILRINEHSVRRLERCGLLCALPGHGSRSVYDLAEVQELADRPPVEHQGANGVLDVHVGHHLPDPTGNRPRYGWQVGDDPEDPVTQMAVAGYWRPVGGPDRWKGKRLVADVSGFIVVEYRIAGFERYPGGFVRFTVQVPRKTAFVGKRVRVGRGPSSQEI